MKKTFVTIFFIIIIVPFMLSISFINGFVTKYDAVLYGFVDKSTRPDKPDIIIGNYLNGSYQEQYSKWFDSNLFPHGFLTKVYNTIQYNLFSKNLYIIGNNKDVIFYENIINQYYALTEEYDYSLQKNQQTVQEYVRHLESVCKKLKKYNKEIYVYIAPTKIYFFKDNIPSKYQMRAMDNRVTAVDYLRMLLDNTEIAHRFFVDMKDELQYPPFYLSGIHWSRTYEQLASKTIIADLNYISNKSYRNFNLGKANESINPFWRDEDAQQLLNVWNRTDESYYEYDVKREYPDKYDKLRIFIWGDSFSDGLIKDIVDNYPTSEVHSTFYNKVYRYRGVDQKVLNENWSNLDWQKCLDNSDVIILGIADVNILTYKDGFIDYLDSFLDSYVPSNAVTSTLEKFDAYDVIPVDTQYSSGIYDKENGFAWIKPSCSIIMDNSMKSDVKIIYNVPDVLCDGVEEEKVYVYLNGYKVAERHYGKGMTDEVFITQDKINELNVEQGNLDIEIYSTRSFIPSLCGMGDDNRDLALQLVYVGSVK